MQSGSSSVDTLNTLLTCTQFKFLKKVPRHMLMLKMVLCCLLKPPLTFAANYEATAPL